MTSFDAVLNGDGPDMLSIVAFDYADAGLRDDAENLVDRFLAHSSTHPPPDARATQMAGLRKARGHPEAAARWYRAGRQRLPTTVSRPA